MRERGVDGKLEDRLWDRMPAVGREFGSQDFERLMEEDRRLGAGVFDPELRREVETTENHRAELRSRLANASRSQDCRPYQDVHFDLK
jgi:hypothetical protein